jgi:hypothetical protein
MDAEPIAAMIWLHRLGCANPVYFLTSAAAGRPPVPWHRALDYFRDECLYADPGVVDQAWATEWNGCAPPFPLNVCLPQHAFPVHDDVSDKGFMVALEAVASDHWEVSDAFARFAPTAGASPLAGLLDLLGWVEQAWESQEHSILPLRWWRALRVELLCRLHMDDIDGESLQFPLVVALLRALVASVTGQLPLSDGPVFATGTVSPDGSIGPVFCVPQKLEAFVREYGAGRPALLTMQQQHEVQDKAPAALAQVCVCTVASLGDLVTMPGIREGLAIISTDLHPSKAPGLLKLVESLTRSIRFEEVARLSQWVLDSLDSPYYGYQFLRNSAQVAFHQWRFADGAEILSRARKLLQDPCQSFAPEDRASFLTSVCNVAVDGCEPGAFRDCALWNGLRLADLRGPARVEVLGSWCQFHRMFGNPAEAIRCGQDAVALADTVYPDSAGRSRNYLIHALLVACRESNGPSGAGPGTHYLDQARTLLAESMGVWAPQDDAEARTSHLLFCLPLAAEIARLSGQAFALPDTTQPPDGIWDHPWHFAQLSSARNAQHGRAERAQALDRLVAGSERITARMGRDSLFGLFDAVFRLYQAAFTGADLALPRQVVGVWLEDTAARGFPGWRDYLTPELAAVTDLPGAERLCNAIRYF